MKIGFRRQSATFGAITTAFAALVAGLLANHLAIAADIPQDSLKLAPGVVKASGYETPPANAYIVANSTGVYNDHVIYGTSVTGQLKRGEKAPVLAKVKGWDWLLIGKDGVGIGYVPTSMVSPEDKYVP